MRDQRAEPRLVLSPVKVFSKARPFERERHLTAKRFKGVDKLSRNRSRSGEEENAAHLLSNRQRQGERDRASGRAQRLDHLGRNARGPLLRWLRHRLT